MPPRKTQPKRGRPSKPRFALMSAPRRRMLYNPLPVFTETFRHSTITSNSAFTLGASMDQVPQLAQYTALYQKYKIVKATWLIMPTYTGGTDENAAMYNNSVLPVGTIQSVGTARVVFAINDTPAQVSPANEQAVLEQNGCQIRFLSQKLTIHNRPVPDTKDSNGVQMSFKKKYINFATPNVTHWGVVGWITQPLTAGVPNQQSFYVYCKLTFQLSDPR